MSDTNYDASSIGHLAGPEAVRANFTMYMGDAGEQCVFTMAREGTDNSIDEALAGHCDQIMLYRDAHGYFYVLDNGRGIPTGNTSASDALTGNKVSMPAIQVATGLLHGGSKSHASKSSVDNKAYAVSRGVHGIGITGTNFLSKTFEMWSCFKGNWHYIAYKNGKLVKYEPKAKQPKLPHKNALMPKGTMVRFTPDDSVVGAKSFPHQMFEEYAALASYFTPGLTISYVYEDPKEGQIRKDWFAENGAADYVNARLQALGVEEVEATFINFSNSLADVVVAFTNHSSPDFTAFTNGLKNASRGTHYDSVFSAMFTAVKPFMNSRHKFDESQLRDGAIGLVNVKLDAPKFSGQTKERLSDPRVGAPLREILVEKFTEVFKQNKALVTRLMERWQRLYELKANYTRSRETDKTIKARLGAGLSPKAACSPRCTPEQRELFLVEGDSAAGAAKQARLPFFQEILPLRGKMGNASRASDDAEGQAKVVAGKSTMDIIAQIGYDPTKPDPIAAMRVRGKIIALVDPDPDGDHIANLVLGLHLRLIPQVFDRVLGLMYILEPAEYWSLYKDVPYFGNSQDDLHQKLRAVGAPASQPIRHLKGWGELDYKYLRIAAFNPETRRLRRIVSMDSSSATKFIAITGNDPTERKRLLNI